MEQAVAAYEQLTVASTQAAASQDRVAASMDRVVGGGVAAHGMLRVMEGSMMGASRAGGEFLATTLGLGPALSAAFPIIGAAAMGFILIDITKSLVKFGEKAEDLSNELGISWLDGAIGQMNGLADAVKDADKEIESLNKDLDQTRERGQQAAVEHIRLTEGPAAGYRAEAASDKQKEIANEAQLVNLLRDKADLERRSGEMRPSKASFSGGQVIVDAPERTTAALEAAKQLEVVNKQISDYQATNNSLLQEAANLELRAAQVKDKKEPINKEDASNFEVERLMAAEAIKDEKDITKAIEERQKAFGEMVVEMARDNDEAAKQSERVTEEITSAWARSYEEQIRDAERAAKEKEALEDKLRARQEAQARHVAEVQKSVIDGMMHDMNRGVDAWLKGGESMARVWTDVGDRMALSVVNALTTIAAEELIGLALHKTVNLETRLDDAKTAAAGAYKATVGIPYIGPILAPIAAGVAFAAVAAFDVGSDYVPKTGMAVIHQGERIIPSGQNAQITQALAGGKSGQGGDNHFHYSPNITGIDGASVAGMARQHGQTFMRQAHRQMRLMGRSQAA